MEKITVLIERLKASGVTGVWELNLLIDILIAIGIAMAFDIISVPITTFIVRLILPKGRKKARARIRESAFYMPIRAFISITGVYIGSKMLEFPEKIINIINLSYKIIIIYLITRLIAGLVNPKSKFFRKILFSANFSGNEIVTKMICKIIRAIIYIISGFIIIKELGYDLNGLATGLGISSVVVALAVQDIAKNLLAGMVLLVDKSFKVGDFIETDKYSGIVEEITFRSIHIRATDSRVITIPTSSIATTSVINYSKMKKRRYEFDLVVTYKATLAQINKTIQDINYALKTNPQADPDTVLVTFNEISNFGITIHIIVDFNSPEWLGFMKFKENINEVMLQILNENGVELAYPSQTMYIENKDILKLEEAKEDLRRQLKKEFEELKQDEIKENQATEN